MPRESAVRRGDVWAYMVTLRGPLVPARIVIPPAHYAADIRIRRLDDPAEPEVSGRRSGLPCRWVDVEAGLGQHPELVRGDAALDLDETELKFRGAADELLGMGVATLRKILRAKLERTLHPPTKLAYTYAEAAVAVGLSKSTLRAAVQRNELIAAYSGSKPLILLEELRRWLQTLPQEPRSP